MGDAYQLRERAARLFALALRLREFHGGSVAADDLERLANEFLDQAEAIEREQK